jgi:hypothetical protein
MAINMIEKIAFLNHNRNLMHPINREKMYWFFREQFRFGHREVLLDYLDLDYSHLIEGFLQHGAHPHTRIGYWPYQKLPRSFSKFYSSFVWSKQAELSAQDDGHRHVKAIGAPWLYFLSDLGYFSDGKIKDIEIHKPVRDLLIVPSHGSGHYFANSHYGIMVERIRNRIGDVDASVLLYYTEFCDPDVRREWLSKGFALECSGFAWGAEHRTLWTYNGGRPDFLKNTMKVLLQHREVICTSPTTLAIYSSSLGIPTSILIDPEFSQALGIVNEGKGVDRLRDYDSKVGELSKKLLGESFAVRELTESKIKLSLKYLGVESFQSPQSLRAILPLTSGMIPVPSEE